MRIARSVATTLLLTTVLSLWLVGPARAAIVFDNTTTPTSGGTLAPNGFLEFNSWSATPLPIGDQIELAGTDRDVTQFDVMLSSTAPDTLGALTLKLWDFDPVNHTPTDKLWEGTLNNVQVDGQTMVSFTVPHVTVPDVLVWTVESSSDVAGLATYDPPTVGVDSKYPGLGDFWWAWNTQWLMQWLGGDPVSDFGARVSAVPEPASMLLFSLGAGLLLKRRGR